MLSLLLSFFLMSEVQVNVCDGERLVFQKEEQIIQADFFNILFYDEGGRLSACEKMANAKRIDIETEVNMEDGHPLLVYVFVDGELLQEILVNEGLAREALHDPSLKYHDLKKDEEEDVAVFSTLNPENEVSRSYVAFLYTLFALILLVFFLIM